jgi:FkbM family methyltransferase
MKQFVKLILNKLGYRITKLHNTILHDIEDPFQVARLLLKQPEKHSIFFDVGANTGQTIDILCNVFPMSTIFAFEPGDAFRTLKDKYQNQKNILLENLGLGSQEKKVKFHNNSYSDMSSVLPMTTGGWGRITTESEITLTTVDRYCRNKSINHISLLKSDTQGYDLEVLRGAEEMLPKTNLILLEINFAELYQGQATFAEILEFLAKRNFRLVKLFSMHYSQTSMTMADALFINERFV